MRPPDPTRPARSRVRCGRSWPRSRKPRPVRSPSSPPTPTPRAAAAVRGGGRGTRAWPAVARTRVRPVASHVPGASAATDLDRRDPPAHRRRAGRGPAGRAGVEHRRASGTGSAPAPRPRCRPGRLRMRGALAADAQRAAGAVPTARTVHPHHPHAPCRPRRCGWASPATCPGRWSSSPARSPRPRGSWPTPPATPWSTPPPPR